MNIHSSATARAGLLLLAAALLAALCWSAWPAGRAGDGQEYLAMSQAFVSHGTPAIRASDVEQIIARNHGRGADGFTAEVADAWLAQMAHGENGYGLYRTGNGRYYSYHFWLYSLVNAPALILCQRVNAPQYSSFLLTNSALLLGAIAIILWAPLLSMRRKIALILLSLGCGSTFYVPWTGPEVMCFALIAAGLVLLEIRRFGWALLAFSAATQQNPPIGLLAVVTGVVGCYLAWKQWRTAGFDKSVLTRLLCLAPGALVLISSPVFYFATFGTPNLIIKAGGTQLSLISIERLVSLFFDLNQGLLVAMPWVFLAVVVLLVMGMWERRREFWMAIGLIASMIVMAVPALSQINWNGGEIIIARYAYWLSASLIYACALQMDALLDKWSFPLVAGALVAGQGAVLASLGVLGTTYFYVSESPAALWVLNHHPSWYAPVPEIFIERGLHREGGPYDGATYDAKSYIYVHDGQLKLALAKRGPVFAISELCRHSGKSFSERASEQGWHYIYPEGRCPVNIADGFYEFPNPPVALEPGVANRLGSTASYIGEGLPGLKTPEEWGTWTDRRRVILPFLLPAQVNGRPVGKWMVTLTFHPFVRPGAGIPMQRIVAYANGVAVLDMSFTTNVTVQRTFVAKPKPWEGQQDALVLALHIPTAVSYKELGLSSDSSRLGIGFDSIRVEPVSAND